ncbi:CRISPR-associated helicase/endonuclease Cas3 [Thermococci archaeon]|nr:MAG: CRISPR-associated helicase/endonuclease Cas3 [Thermococci archaeon]
MNKILPSQMIYSLPIRTLVDDLTQRFRRYANVKWLNVAGHHGKRVETPLFYPPIIITTIDQTVGAYACTPLSLSLRHGNIPAGAVSSSFLVFDEVHTFDPKRALQSALILAKHSRKLKLPFVFMSATMPDYFINKLSRIFKLGEELVIDVNEGEIPIRKNRSVIIHWKNRELTSEEVIERFTESKDKLIVVCNTVDKAQNLYANLEEIVDCEIILLHSRFLEKHRKEKEKRLKEIFGKNSKKRGILISTQVIEVGLDISCDNILTELSPIDSLIQRAGRCARWGGKGNLYIYDVEKSSPYEKKIVDETKRKIKDINGQKLDWETEKILVNDILGKYVEQWLKIENRASALNLLSRAAFEGSRKIAEDAVREVFSSEISIHENPYSLESPYKLEKIKINTWILRKFFNDEQPTMWEFVDNNIISDDSSNIIPQKISSVEEILPYRFYIIHPDDISYDENKGLLFESGGKNFECMEKERHEEVKYEYEKESWVDHSKKTLEVFENIFLLRYKFAINKFASAWKIDVNEFLNKLRIAMLLHDIGKLNEEWQKKVGWQEGEEPLAHSGEESIKSLPSHAPISAYSLKEVFKHWKIGEAILYAISHHHSLRASRVSKYKFISEWKNQVFEVTKDIKLEINLNEIRSCTKSVPQQLRKFPDFMNEKLYRTYTFFSRILRLSDQIATAGDEGAVLRYENWHENV